MAQSQASKSNGKRGGNRDIPFVRANPHAQRQSMMVPYGSVKLSQLTDRNWKDELGDMLHVYGRIRKGSANAVASEQTLLQRKTVLRNQIGALMRAKSNTINCLAHVLPRHIPWLIDHWNETAVSKRTQLNYYTHFAWFWSVCGIVVPSIHSFEKTKGEYTVNYNATRDKSWEGNGVDFEMIYEKVKAIDPIAAEILRVQDVFGLRPKEAICLRPHESDQGDALQIVRGSKTGRKRTLLFSDFFDDDQYRILLNKMKKEVAEDMHIAWKNRTLKQAKERMYTICRKIGLRKNGVYKVSMYGLRTGFAIRAFERLTGQQVPVKGGIALNLREIAEARMKVSRGMGHNRKRVVGAYYGSFITYEREQMRGFLANWAKIEEVMSQEVCSLIHDSGIDNLYWVGVLATGQRNSGNAVSYEFVLPPNVDPALAASVCPAIADLVSKHAQCDAIVMPWNLLQDGKQVLYQETAIPMFATVSPAEFMQSYIEESKNARLKGTKDIFEAYESGMAVESTELDRSGGVVRANDVEPDQSDLFGEATSTKRKRIRKKKSAVSEE